jgi:hypothetical protein
VKAIVCTLCTWATPPTFDEDGAAALSVLHVATEHPVHYEAITGREAIELIDQERVAITRCIVMGLL